MIDIKKALGTDDAGNVLVQPEIDKTIQALVEYKNPLRVNIPRKPGSGSHYYVNRRTAGSTPAEFVSDTDSITEDTGSYARTSFEFKTIATKGRVTRKMQAIGRSYVDVLASEMEEKARDFKDYEEWALFYGNSSSSSKQFDGLDELVTQTVATTDQSGGDALTLEKLDEAIDTCAGEPDMLIMSKRTRRQLNSLLQAQQRFVDSIEVKGGFQVMSYNNIPVFVSTRVNNTQSFDGSSVTGQTGGDCSTIYALESDYCFVSELTPITVEPLAKSTSQYDQFDIYSDEALVLTNTLHACRLIGITS